MTGPAPDCQQRPAGRFRPDRDNDRPRFGHHRLGGGGIAHSKLGAVVIIQRLVRMRQARRKYNKLHNTYLSGR